MSGQTPITCIIVRIITADVTDAGSDGDVYIGIGGREFYVDTPHDSSRVPTTDDFERGQDRGYILGEYTGPPLPMYTVGQPGNEIVNPKGNDPREPYPLYVEDLGYFPIYIRSTGHPRPEMVQHSHKDDYWTLGYVSITVNPLSDNIVFEALSSPTSRPPSRTLTFGRLWGYILYLKNTQTQRLR
jgi:hypothetical protein